MSRLHPFGVRMPTRPDYPLQTPKPKPSNRRTDLNNTPNAYLELINATAPPLHINTVPCDEPLPYNLQKDLQTRLRSSNSTIFEDSTATPLQLSHPRNREASRLLTAFNKKHARNVKLEMLIHLNKCEYEYMRTIMDWILPLAQRMDDACGDSMVPLINNYKHNCHFFETAYLTTPVNTMRKAQAEGRTREFESMQNLVERTVMKCHLHVTMLLDTLMMIAFRVEAAREKGFNFVFPETEDAPECAEAIMKYVSARGWGVCLDEKLDEYWMIRRKVWGSITQIHIGYDLIKNNEVERGNFKPWMNSMMKAVKDNVTEQDLRARRVND
ncbi:hypothetical protein HYFRA_00007178 [Hymenoscyphus fraxineus]|uniref:Uncharacterized protein n=1 Tax=Hymenoscyphus fraxineus TaxID=746836 RepID=A0A9N9PPY3_9HELO|nr:hypothetical protein HYFRA_00007178 [Hymenoscyphus fraxineus]